MSLGYKLFASFVHLILIYTVFSILLVSNDIDILMCILIFMVLVKISFHYYGRIILTSLEENDTFSSVSTLYSKMFSPEITSEVGEEIIINFGLLLILTKLFVLFIMNNKVPIQL